MILIDSVLFSNTMLSPALEEAPYTIHSLPYGVISTQSEPSPRCAVAIGQHAIDLAKYAKTGALSSLEAELNLSFEKIFAEVRILSNFQHST